MSPVNPNSAARKPSGSSTHSGARSPSGSHSPSRVQAQRNLGAASNLFNSGMAPPKPVNHNGWQIWGEATPSSRHPSGSSASSGHEPSASHPYRTNVDGSWSSSRSPSGAWEEVNVQRKDNQSRGIPHPAALGGAPTSIPKSSQYPSQQLDYANAKEIAHQSRYPGASPTRPTVGLSSFPIPQPATHGGPLTGQAQLAHPSSVVEKDLSMAMRGMAVEDDFAVQNTPFRVQQPNRTPYPTFPQADYSPYYSPVAPRVDYPYFSQPDPSVYGGSPALSPPAVAASSVYPSMGMQPIHHAQHPGHVMFDYSGTPRPSQFYYPPQAVLYHGHQPTVHSGLTPPLAEQKPLVAQQFNNPSHLHPGSHSRAMPGSGALAHHRSYSMVDAGNAVSMMLPGMLFGQSGLPSPGFPGHRGRRGGQAYGQEQHPLRGKVLESFRTERNRTWEIKEIFGHVVEFSTDQHGSRFLQQKFEHATNQERQVVFEEIVPQHALRLVQDVFGNYVIQKIFEFGTPSQRNQLAACMQGHILSLSLQMYGCRVVQKAVEFITPEEQSAFLNELDGHALQCVKDANGNHVIQKLIEHVPAERLHFTAGFVGHVFELASHPYGCRVLQRCLEYLPDSHTRRLMEELHRCVINLMQDQFGNYVVQFVLEHGQPEDSKRIISRLRGHVLQLSRHKFASNVCEKALVNAPSDLRQELIHEIMTPKENGQDPIMVMMKDQFANYVLQRAISTVEGDLNAVLVNHVKQLLASIRKSSGPFGKHLSAIERLVEKAANTDTPVTTRETQPHSTAKPSSRSENIH